ncbi:MAG: SH3 domain-containing protein [Paracoccaceae bacterium]
MFKLIALLCAAMFTVLLIGGEDRGQLRPGLENAPAITAESTPAPAEQAPVLVAAAPVAAADAAPAEVASVSAPVTVESATTPETEAAITETVFSLANYSNEAPVEAAPVEPQTAGDLAYVDAQSVNVREGPGTQNAVLTKLTRGEAVTIVSTDDTGWARIRLEGDGIEGFMSMEYLSATAP